MPSSEVGRPVHFLAYFALGIADQIGLDITLDIYEPQNFFMTMPRSCNKCGGIISETLIQNLAVEGINIPAPIIQRGINSYTLYTDKGKVEIQTPTNERRIGAVHRGCGPKDLKETKWGSFDGFLQILALEKGANLFQNRVGEIDLNNEHPKIIAHDMEPREYDLVVMATGVNAKSIKFTNDQIFKYKAPETKRTMIREYYLGHDEVSKYFGDSMHIFIVDMPQIEFAAYIPKGDYVTLCILGDKIDAKVLEEFVNQPPVYNILPESIRESITSCSCAPLINVQRVTKPYHDRMVFVGDSSATRLYKDGIGAAYRTAKVAATTAILHGIAEEDFKEHYWPVCKAIEKDNRYGKFIFFAINIIQKIKITKRAFFEMTRQEQEEGREKKPMSTVLWDMFTGSATYREIFALTLTPAFLINFNKNIVTSLFQMGQNKER